MYVAELSPSHIKRPLSSDNEKDQPPKKTAKITELHTRRLPIPCPTPTAFSQVVHSALLQNDISGTIKLKRMLRESAAFFYGLCPVPKPSEYQEMSKSLCDKYPLLKDLDSPNGEYWVN